MVIADIDGVNEGDLPKNYMGQANASVIIITGVMTTLGILAVVAIVTVTGQHAENYDGGLPVPPLSAFPLPPSSVAGSNVSANASLAESAVSSNHPHEAIEGATGTQDIDQSVESVKDDNANEII